MKKRVSGSARRFSIPLSFFLLILAAHASAQTVSSFTMDRYSTAGEGQFETFYVEEIGSLQEAVDNGVLAGETMMLVTETAEGYLGLVRDQMAFHHIAQGRAAGKNWMATF